MSILHSRVTRQDNLTGPDLHPYGTAGTPMVMPMSTHTYAGDTVLYGTAHPLVTADGGVVPATADVHYPDAIPAGRP